MRRKLVVKFSLVSHLHNIKNNRLGNEHTLNITRFKGASDSQHICQSVVVERTNIADIQKSYHKKRLRTRHQKNLKIEYKTDFNRITRCVEGQYNTHKIFQIKFLVFLIQFPLTTERIRITRAFHEIFQMPTYGN